MSDEQEHITNITDSCYGITGGIRVDCSCGSYWVMAQPRKGQTSEGLLATSTANHIGTTKKPVTKPD